MKSDEMHPKPTRNQVYCLQYRGFESLSLRQKEAATNPMAAASSFCALCVLAV
ncbi:hypothetical protein [uncultured Acetobacteroides sp.]|uniref:hypothetical protein n=1 Tax=uncultured Acetobacteroides sp. TaxID=1760811 RepID=UPI0029F45B0E|nr:hypothetical protein [uncultured Acetobacteroides sp.]